MSAAQRFRRISFQVLRLSPTWEASGLYPIRPQWLQLLGLTARILAQIVTGLALQQQPAVRPCSLIIV